MKAITRIGTGVIVTLFVALTGLSTPTRAWGQQSYRGSDQTIKEILEHRLRKDYILKDDNIELAVANGVITLTGTVHTLAEKHEAERDVQQEHGYHIANHLTLEPTTLSDHQIAEKLLRRIRRHVFYSYYDWIGVRVEDGVATLEGWIAEPYHAADFVRQAEKVRGVRQVKNELQQLPTNPLDDQIRHDAARAIYGNRTLEYYGYEQVHPIHIIVENGAVILEGQVESEAHKNLVERLVRLNTNAFSVTNLLKIGRIESS